ncbi:MAG: glycoside hydrolase family 44 protein [Actinoplanes sp.]
MRARRWGMLRPGMTIGVAMSVVAAGLTTQAAATPAVAATGLTLSVDVSAARHAISPDIYGLNGADPAFAAEIGMPVARWGGNASSRYNFKNHTYNTGSDWYFENIVAGADNTLESFVTTNRNRGTKQIVTVPMIGWVAKDSPSSHPFACGFPATRFPAQDEFDPWDANCGNGKLDGTNISGADPTDTSISADASFAGEMVSHLVSRFGTAARGGVRIYELDNEPVLWSSTHRDVHPQAVTYDELGSKGTATAAAIKAADPSAAVLGPSGWGYCEWVASGLDGYAPGADAAAHGGRDFSQWYLKNMKDFGDAHGGRRFLNYFDQHYYPQISGGKDPEANALRLRSTRSLWDPTYVEESWIGPSGVNAPPLQFIRTMKAWVAQYYPGTKVAITEYNWGALDDINGACPRPGRSPRPALPVRRSSANWRRSRRRTRPLPQRHTFGQRKAIMENPHRGNTIRRRPADPDLPPPPDGFAHRSKSGPDVAPYEPPHRRPGPPTIGTFDQLKG